MPSTCRPSGWCAWFLAHQEIQSSPVVKNLGTKVNTGRVSRDFADKPILIGCRGLRDGQQKGVDWEGTTCLIDAIDHGDPMVKSQDNCCCVRAAQNRDMKTFQFSFYCTICPLVLWGNVVKFQYTNAIDIISIYLGFSSCV